ncbi:mitogen-activated protein kinase kinase kinase 18-like [Rutidosis leptorrhynchoides]|uniref:mitogen-activated protein kinase kinase kinase 18-like n=1 Tax=Rutidosis leptorrhynchoides TaxID=125765 RepID=UPI003A994529
MASYNNATKPNWVRKTCIGRGSFGVVSLAVEEVNNVTFAVKSVENKPSSEFVQCLENEIRILKALSSPYVVTYLGDDVTCEFSSVYRNLHMEYLPNGTVADVATEGNIMNLRSYTRCITSGLSYIHSKNIVHCDVKGKNVLIGNTPGLAKLADFGSAIEFGLNEKIRGSPLWMAPEVIRGEYQGPESDVWSLGCTVIEMLTGQLIWHNIGFDILRQIKYSNELLIPELSNTSTPVPNDLIDFLDKCLRRERSDRWSCDQLLHLPFLLPCSSPSLSSLIAINEYELSPRCAFDWCDSSSSNESTLEIDNSDMKKLEAKQRIGKLATNSGVNWGSEGWEVVRHVTSDTSSDYLEQRETTTEYSNSADNEGSVSGHEGINLVYTESVSSYSYDLESTTNSAERTTVVWMYRHRDSVHMLSRYIFLLIKYLVTFNLNLCIRFSTTMRMGLLRN